MKIKTGLEVFLTENYHAYRNLKFGLVTHPAAVLPDLTHALDALLSNGFNVTALFGPEHGLYGFEADAQAIDYQDDPRTGLPIYSLYGDKLKPSEKMLSGLDALVFDMHSLSSRSLSVVCHRYYSNLCGHHFQRMNLQDLTRASRHLSARAAPP